MAGARRVFMVGNFSYATGKVNGQSMKTRNVRALLDKENIPYSYYDTSFLGKKKLNIKQFVTGVKNCDDIVFLLNKRGLLVFFPLLFILGKLFNRRLIYLVVGGWLAEFVQSRRLLRFMLKRVDSIMVETKGLLEKLQKQGFGKVRILGNFKVTSFLQVKNFVPDSSELNVVFAARATKSKGLDIIREISKDLPEVLFDIYGPLHTADDEAYLQKVCVEANVNYKGVLDQSEIHKTIQGYDIMIFPTHYKGEGFPGTILDAYIAGIPVIASDWRYNKELVKPGETGFVFSLDDLEGLVDLLKQLKDKSRLQSLYKNMEDARSIYSYESLAEPLINELKEN